MANFRRRRPRIRTHRAIRGSDTSWRAKWGFHPARITKEHWKLEGAEWDALWHPRGRHGNSGKKIGGPYCPMHSYPKRHDLMHHTRPRRRRTKIIEIAIAKGAKDPDNVCWPLAKKPHIYYW